MKQLEKFIRGELLQAPKGICLTIYIPEGTTDSRCDHLKECIVDATNYLRKIFSSSEMNDFLRPIASLTHEDIGKFEAGIAFFRSAYDFRAIGVPELNSAECVVSDHYNIKPLLKWLQNDIEFFCVEILNGVVDIFRGVPGSFSSAGCYGIVADNIREIESCILENSEEGVDTKVFFSGNIKECKSVMEKTRLRCVDNSVIDRSVYQGDYELLYETLMDRIRHMAILRIKKGLLDYNKAVMDGRGSSNLEEIIDAAKHGKILKLIVSEEHKVWGRFGAYKNQINRVNKQINYEDDDLLDSISEDVLKRGGEVIVASSRHLPTGKKMLAILSEQSKAA